jgi:chromate transporter
MAQAVPGPLFTFAAYLGAVMRPPQLGGWSGSVLCLIALFLPGLLLMAGILPFWTAICRWPKALAALRGANAAVVGLLAAALWQVATASAFIEHPAAIGIALAALAALAFTRCAPWLVVAWCAAAGEALLR